MEPSTLVSLTPPTTPTIKEYLNDSYLFELSNVKLLQVEDFPKDQNSFSLIFDKTIFHPQGGGQPSDEGEIVFKSIKLTVEGLGYDRERDIVNHKISREKFISSGITIGDILTLNINGEKRTQYARLHSGGHLLDIAVTKLGLNIIPSKGYHFQDGPYVEYIGNIDKNSIPSLQIQIEKVSNEVITNSDINDLAITKFYDYEEGKKEFLSVPSYLPENKPFRWVKLLKNDLGCPCGGTHVKHVKDINEIKITKITNKGKIVRVSYNVI